MPELREKIETQGEEVEELKEKVEEQRRKIENLELQIEKVNILGEYLKNKGALEEIKETIEKEVESR